MTVQFISDNPRMRAKPWLDQILSSGTDQIAIACAFMTGGGVELLKPHAARLALQNSFLVVAWEEPTNLEAVAELHPLIPGNLYLHLGAKTPVEKGVGRGLMHSKVLFSRRGDECSLWTGSHNLTASATLGVNCEAAVLLKGTVDEQPFQDALAHLERCKTEAVMFDPSDPPPLPDQQVLVIHAERDVALKAIPWFVHLRAATIDYDRAMRPPGAVWLYLYPPGSLQPGRPRPAAMAAFSGRLTALNFTEFHPRDPGIPADWQDADFVIEHRNGLFHLSEPTPHSTTPTQGVFRVDAQEDPNTVWLTKSPSARLEKIVGETHLEAVEPEFKKFFTKQSVFGSNLVHRVYRRLRQVYRVPRKEVGELDEALLTERMDLGIDTEIEIEELSQRSDKFAFIYRAKYRA